MRLNRIITIKAFFRIFSLLFCIQISIYPIAHLLIVGLQRNMKNSIETNHKKLFLRDEYEALLNAIDNLNNQIDDIGQQIGEMTTQSSETWHDNAGFDECQRMMALLSIRKKELQSLVNHIHIVEPTTHNHEVSIGSKLIIKVDDQYKEICI